MKAFWKIFHHAVAHPILGLTYGRVWAWKFHDWSAKKAWPEEDYDDLSTESGLD